MWKIYDIIMLTAKEKANIGLSQPFNVLYYHEHVVSHEGQHLYITSDEEIKEGEKGFVVFNKVWGVPQPNGGRIIEVIGIYQKSHKHSREYVTKTGTVNISDCTGKIIATTDISLGLPKPSQQYIQKYVEEYNKGNVISKVMVEYDEHHEEDTSKEYIPGMGQPAIKIQELIINSNNTINIKSIKDSWSREEVEALLFNFMNRPIIIHDLGILMPLNEWIKQNL